MAEFDLDDSGGLEFDEYVQLVAAVQVRRTEELKREGCIGAACSLPRES